MKRVIRSRIVAFIIGALLFSGVSVYATYSILANDIGYTPSNDSWNVDNVQDAINYLYDKTNVLNDLDCVSSQVHHNSNTQFDINLGFVPTKFYASYHWNNENMDLYVLYDSQINNNFYLSYYETNGNAMIENYSSRFMFEDNHFKSNIGGRSLNNEYDFYYVACK